MRWLVTGASGQLGSYLLRELQLAGRQAAAWSNSSTGTLFGFDLVPVNLADPKQLNRAFTTAKPDVVIHAAALASVAACHRQPDQARQVNTEGTGMLAELCERHKARLVHVSTDLVFDGTRGHYREDDAPNPLSVYGRSKRDAEGPVLAMSRGVVARVSLLFGPSLIGRPSFFDEQMAALRAQKPIVLFEDEWRTPLSLITAAKALLALGQSEEKGIFHIGGPERMTRLEMGRRLAKHLGVDDSCLVAAKRDDQPAPEQRPRDVSLDSSLWRERFSEQEWPEWEQALERQ